MKGVAAFVLAGGRVMEMGVLTDKRAKAAVPFAGTYRIIDFAMSNLGVSGVERVGVLSQYRPSSLMDHVRNGEAWGLVGRGREVQILPPYQAENRVDWYKGTADAVYQNLGFLKDAERVLICSGDHVYNMDYSLVLEEHIARRADLTMVFKRFKREDCARFGNAVIDEGNRVTWYQEKPAVPRSDLGSLTIFLFEREILEHYLRAAYRQQGQLQHLYDQVVPRIVREGHVHAFEFHGYWAYTRTIDDYYAASMDLFNAASGFDLDTWGVMTNTEESGVGDKGPAWVGPGAEVVSARLSPGCEVQGRVARSILSPGVVVEEGAVVEDSVIMHGVRVQRGTHVVRSIVDKGVLIGADCRIGHSGPAVPNIKAASYHTCGVTVVGRDARISSGAVIGANVQVAPGQRIAGDARIPDGAFVERDGEEPWFERW